MSKKQNVTVEELRSLLVSRFSADQLKQEKLKFRIQQELTIKVWMGKPVLNADENRLINWISHIVARRLKRNQQTIPLLSYRDFSPAYMIKEASKANNIVLDQKSLKITQSFIKEAISKPLQTKVFEKGLEIVTRMVPPSKGAYREYWRWVTVVLEFATKRGITPIHLLSLEATTDEIVRRMFSKDEFSALSKKATTGFMEAEVLKAIMTRPILNKLAEDKGEDFSLLKQKILAEVMPDVRAIGMRSMLIANTWRGEEIVRIYGVA